MSQVPPNDVLVLAATLFALGLMAVVARRNLVFIMMGIEIMLNAAGLAFVAAGARHGQADGQIMFILVLTLAAAEVSVGLALVLQLYRCISTLDADAADALKG